MAKAKSPLRLQEELIRAASIDGPRLHRSIAEQVEYWAELGRKVSKVIDPDDLLAVSAGIATINIVKVAVPDVDPEDVFASLDEDHRTGRLAKSIAQRSPVRYQASRSHPGMLERIDEQGSVSVGQFRDGEFHPGTRALQATM
jgi:hypothetical protein